MGFLELNLQLKLIPSLQHERSGLLPGIKCLLAFSLNSSWHLLSYDVILKIVFMFDNEKNEISNF